MLMNWLFPDCLVSAAFINFRDLQSSVLLSIIFQAYLTHKWQSQENELCFSLMTSDFEYGKVLISRNLPRPLFFYLFAPNLPP